MTEFRHTPAPPAPPRDSRTATVAVWMPWVAAPLFCLLPIGGCAVAGSLRQAVARAESTTATKPLPGPAAITGGPHGAVAPILTASSR
jgi:hypothetical protein